MAAKSRKEQLEEMLADDPNDPFLRYGLAMEYVSAGDNAAAAKQFQDLIAVVPDYAPAYLQGGQALLRLERSDEARELWNRGVAVAKQAGNTHAADEMARFLMELD
ncbi:MAG: tetratricopeptide repeat protein [Gemmataceae bacterium]|nr:tetratricopeptide repeat protein [Gemmataceae bacterium]